MLKWASSTEDKGGFIKDSYRTKMNCMSTKYKCIRGKLTDDECIIILFMVLFQTVAFLSHGTAEDAKWLSGYSVNNSNYGSTFHSGHSSSMCVLVPVVCLDMSVSARLFKD